MNSSIEGTGATGKGLNGARLAELVTVHARPAEIRSRSECAHRQV